MTRARPNVIQKYIWHLKNESDPHWSDPFDYLPNYLLVKISSGHLFMIFNVESNSRSLTAPIITHLGIDRDFIATASIRK